MGGSIGNDDVTADLSTLVSERSGVPLAGHAGYHAGTSGTLSSRPSWSALVVRTVGRGRAERIDRCISPAAALGIYCVCSVGLFGGPLLANPDEVSLGARGDPALFMWCLAWWPYALLHRLNPFITTLVYAPAGFNLSWATSVPALALLAAPLTLTAGPVVSFNVLMLLAPALAAWSAFLLCRHLTGRGLPALVAGYLYGYSSYEIGHLWAGHLNLASTFLLPLALLLCLLWYEEKVGQARFIILLGAILVLQMGISQEIFATATLFGGIALGLASIVDKDRRGKHLGLAARVLCAYLVAGVVLIPYLSYVFAQRSSLVGAPDYGTRFLSIELANYLLPTPLTALGGPLLASITSRFVLDNLGEAGGYFGIPLLLMSLYAAKTCWRTRAGMAGVAAALVIALCSFGPALSIFHHAHGPRFGIYMPWAFFGRLPVLRLAIPARLTVYLSLLAAVGAAVWLSGNHASGRTKAVLAALSVIFLLPNMKLPELYGDRRVPRFFEQGMYKTYLRPGENVLILPYGAWDQSMLWQARTGMYFRMAGGYLRYMDPPELTRWRIFPSFLSGGTPFAGYGREFDAFLRGNDVRTVIVAKVPDFLGGVWHSAPEEYAHWKSFVFPVLGSGSEVADVTLYRVPGVYDGH
jgi:hypothetical protein